MTSSVGGRVSLAAGASLLSGQASDRNADATCFVGSIDLKVTEDIIWELFTQVGPVGACIIECSVAFVNYWVRTTGKDLPSSKILSTLVHCSVCIFTKGQSDW